mmetsp:Transcript_20579/g.30942  ORF Transcript_20579/g.30942 Transcript_20579/m.30942 type:complete len:118 (+) Transcript_20579:173-526(+)
MEQDLEYRNILNCNVEVTNSINISQKPVKLPQECWNAASIPIPKLYDFALEKSILKKRDDVERDLKSTGSREDLQRNLMTKMKSVTKAKEDVCVSILENNNYDLKTSVETYFQSSMK